MELLRSAGEFFKEALSDALKSQHVDATESTEFYLVNLLTAFTSTQVDEAPLAIKLAHANEAAPEERVRTLKEVGDTSLYVSGFFADSLARRLVDVDYYMTMGGAAYGQLARATTAKREVFDELADKFPRFVDVLGEIRAKSHFTSSTNVLRLVEEWMKTRSEWIEKRLRAAGVMLGDGRTKQ
jgi:hypothetical protein